MSGEANGASRISFTEGSLDLPPGYDDRTTNLLVPANVQTDPNLSVARDWMKQDETLPAYVDRQLGVLRSQLAGHRLVRRETARLGPEESNPLIGERIDATYKSGKLTISQRQAVFEVAPRRVLVFTGSSLAAFNEAFESLWSQWLSSYEPPAMPSAASTTDDPAPASDGPAPSADQTGA